MSEYDNNYFNNDNGGGGNPNNNMMPRIQFFLRIAWMIFALVIWIIALSAALDPAKGGNSSAGWFECGFLCLIPIAWPVIKFILRAFGVGFAVGSSRWDIDFSNGRIYNHGVGGAILVGVIAIVLVVAAGLIILPIYWVIYGIGTIRMGIEVFRKNS